MQLPQPRWGAGTRWIQKDVGFRPLPSACRAATPPRPRQRLRRQPPVMTQRAPEAGTAAPGGEGVGTRGSARGASRVGVARAAPARRGVTYRRTPVELAVRWPRARACTSPLQRETLGFLRNSRKRTSAFTVSRHTPPCPRACTLGGTQRASWRESTDQEATRAGSRGGAPGSYVAPWCHRTQLTVCQRKFSLTCRMSQLVLRPPHLSVAGCAGDCAVEGETKRHRCTARRSTG